jgi:exodeoxyribonuclease VIII
MLELKHGKNYFSPSQLKKLYISVGQLNAYLKKDYEQIQAMVLGSAVHTAILEPHYWDDRYVVMDNTLICAEIGGKRPTATKAYSDWMEQFQKDNIGKTILSQSEKDIVDKIQKKCALSGILDTYFSGGEAEKTITGVVKDYDEEFEALCIIDYDSDFQSVDLKTTSKPLNKFRYDANELGYDIQAKLTNSLNGKEFVFIVVQTVSPFDIGIFTCSDYFMNRGKDKINTALQNYKNYEDEYSIQILNFEL